MSGKAECNPNNTVRTITMHIEGSMQTPNNRTISLSAPFNMLGPYNNSASMKKNLEARCYAYDMTLISSINLVKTSLRSSFGEMD